MAAIAKKVVQAKIEFCEDELQDAVRFLGYLRSIKRVKEIPAHYAGLYNDEFSKEDNIEMLCERIYDLRRHIDVLHRIADR